MRKIFSLNKRFSLRKLFLNYFEGHEGRPGKVGGSKPRSGGASASDKVEAMRKEHAKKTGGDTTSRKVGNIISRITGERVSRTPGTQYLSGPFSKGDLGSISSALQEEGFEKYSDPYKRDWVTSFKKGKLRVYLDTLGNRVTVSETFEASIPND